LITLFGGVDNAVQCRAQPGAEIEPIGAPGLVAGLGGTLGHSGGPLPFMAFARYGIPAAGKH